MNLKPILAILPLALLGLGACKSSETIVGQCPTPGPDNRSRYAIADAFSPNGDGRNDALTALPDSSRLTAFHLRIFDRSGDQIAAVDDIADPRWYGVDSRTGKVVSPGMYRVNYSLARANGRTYADELWVTVFGNSSTRGCLQIQDCDVRQHTFPDQVDLDGTRYDTAETFCK